MILIFIILCFILLIIIEFVLEKKYMQTDEYVEDVARSQLGLIYPDEIVVKPEE